MASRQVSSGMAADALLPPTPGMAALLDGAGAGAGVTSAGVTPSLRTGGQMGTPGSWPAGIIPGSMRYAVVELLSSGPLDRTALVERVQVRFGLYKIFMYFEG